MESKKLLNLLLLLMMFITRTPLFANDMDSIRNTVLGGTGGGIFFRMGSPDSEFGREPDELSHEVTILKGFQYAATEVTQLQWFEVMGENPSHFKEKKYCENSYDKRRNNQGQRVSLCPDHPVETVSWNDVHHFIEKLNKLDDQYDYRLPTEAEWEYLARGGTESAFSFGDNLHVLSEYGWYDGNSERQTHEVASKKHNPFGLYDVHGNVHEWVEDKYGAYLDESGRHPIFRGGSWYSPAIWCR